MEVIRVRATEDEQAESSTGRLPSEPQFVEESGERLDPGSHTMTDQSHTAGRGAMPTSYVMKVSSNGQVSIPADARARWHPERMLVIDLGDRLVMRPLAEDAVGALTGKYGRSPSTDEARRRAREEDAAAERRKRR